MTRTTDSFRVALVQEAPVFLNVEATLDRVEQLAGECAAEGARVVVFPETWLPGYPVWIDSAPGAALWGEPAAKKLYRLLVANSVRLGDGRLQRLQAVADHHGVVVVIGAHESHGSTLYNTTFGLSRAGSSWRISRPNPPAPTIMTSNMATSDRCAAVNGEDLPGDKAGLLG